VFTISNNIVLFVTQSNLGKKKKTRDNTGNFTVLRVDFHAMRLIGSYPAELSIKQVIDLKFPNTASVRRANIVKSFLKDDILTMEHLRNSIATDEDCFESMGKTTRSILIQKFKRKKYFT